MTLPCGITATIAPWNGNSGCDRQVLVSPNCNVSLHTPGPRSRCGCACVRPHAKREVHVATFESVVVCSATIVYARSPWVLEFPPASSLPRFGTVLERASAEGQRVCVSHTSTL